VLSGVEKSALLESREKTKKTRTEKDDETPSASKRRSRVVAPTGVS
jgi:hypothetical protein